MLQLVGFRFREINFMGVQNVEVIPAITTDPDPNPNRHPNRKLSLLVNGKKI